MDGYTFWVWRAAFFIGVFGLCGGCVGAAVDHRWRGAIVGMIAGVALALPVGWLALHASVATVVLFGACIGAAVDRRPRGAMIGIGVGLASALLVWWLESRSALPVDRLTILWAVVHGSLGAIAGGALWRGRGAALGAAVGLIIGLLLWPVGMM